MSITNDEIGQLLKEAFARIQVLEGNVTKDYVPPRNVTTPRVKSAELLAFAEANPGLIGDDAVCPEGYLNVTDVHVYDVSGRTDLYKERDTGLDGFWVMSTKGKRFLVDVMGVPFFLFNPIRDKAYANRVNVAV